MAVLSRLRRERNRRRKLRSNLLNRAEQHARRIKVLNAAIKRRTSSAVPIAVAGWHPKAIRNQVASPLPFLVGGGADKLVWHTTEGSSLPGYSGSQPHFTLDFKRGLLYQHVPITGGSYALRNLPGGVETNRANCVQVELVGFAREAHTWSDDHYAQIAALARFIERNTHVPRSCSVTFRSTASVKVPNWIGYEGHIGHQHVPENDHWDPGLLQIHKVL